MTHARTTIRAAASAALAAIATPSVVRVPIGSWAWNRAQLPAVAADIVEEDVFSDTFGAADGQVRDATLRITGYVAESLSHPDVSAVLDDLDREIAVALHADATLDAAILDLTFRRMEKEIEASAEDLRGRITLDYRIRYCVDETDP